MSESLFNCAQYHHAVLSLKCLVSGNKHLWVYNVVGFLSAIRDSLLCQLCHHISFYYIWFWKICQKTRLNCNHIAFTWISNIITRWQQHWHALFTLKYRNVSEIIITYSSLVTQNIYLTNIDLVSIVYQIVWNCPDILISMIK